MPVRAPSRLVEKHISLMPGKVQPIMRALRDIVMFAQPDLSEEIAWDMVVYKKKGFIIGAQDESDSLRIQFFHGSKLQDPNGVLQGTGQGIRNLRISNVKDLNQNQIVRWIEESLKFD
jgi:hypothetical protein